MPVSSLAVGALAAVTGVFLEWLLHASWGIAWGSALGVVATTAAALGIQKAVLGRKEPANGSVAPYDGVTDLLIQVHRPAEPDASALWGARSVISALLYLFGGHAGLEGAIVEKARALTLRRSPGARWFEQRRRTDAASALAAGLAVAFQAPFAAFLVPQELGLGGRGLSVGLASLVAFALGKLLRLELGLPLADYMGTLYGARWIQASALLLLALPFVLAALASLMVSGFRLSRDALTERFRAHPWVRALVGGACLCLAYVFYARGAAPIVASFGDMAWGKLSYSQTLVNFGVGALVLALVVSGFGTVGVFWPVFALGAAIGILTVRPALPETAIAGVSQAGWVGAAGFWGALLGIPLSGAVLVFELTGNVEAFLAALAVAGSANWIRRHVMGSPSLVEAGLAARGVALAEGRSLQILGSLHVREAMVTDHEVVLESEPVADLVARHARSKYPFFPVVNAQGRYAGMLTLDGPGSLPVGGPANLAQLLEAKDLLYRAGREVPAVRASDPLSVTQGMFKAIPCVAVVGEDGKVQGLLLAYHVRMAYDREVARLSLGRSRAC